MNRAASSVSKALSFKFSVPRLERPPNTFAGSVPDPKELSFNQSVVRALRLANMSAGSVVKELMFKSRDDMLVRPAKSPDSKDEIL